MSAIRWVLGSHSVSAQASAAPRDCRCQAEQSASWPEDCGLPVGRDSVSRGGRRHRLAARSRACPAGSVHVDLQNLRRQPRALLKRLRARIAGLPRCIGNRTGLSNPVLGGGDRDAPGMRQVPRRHASAETREREQREAIACRSKVGGPVSNTDICSASSARHCGGLNCAPSNGDSSKLTALVSSSLFFTSETIAKALLAGALTAPWHFRRLRGRCWAIRARVVQPRSPVLPVRALRRSPVPC